MSLSDLYEMMEGHKMDIRENYEASRLGAYLSILPHISKSEAKILTPKKLFPFDWEKNIKDKNPITKDDFEHARKLAEIVKSGKIKIKDGKS